MDAPVIVVSDDDEMIVRALERQGARAGLWVVPDTKSEAVQLAALLHPAVVVLDLVQGRDGLDLLREIKADPRNTDVEVVVVSGTARDDTRSACLALGAAEFVPKPLDASFLVSLSRRASSVALGRARAQSNRRRLSLHGTG